MYVAVIAVGLLVVIVAAAWALSKAGESRSALTPGQAEAQIDRLLRDGRKSEAIKMHRQAFNSSLQEAREAIEERRSRISFEG